MYFPVYTKQFRKDLKRCKRRGNDLEELKIIARTLLAGSPLENKHNDHPLAGNYIGRRDLIRVSRGTVLYRVPRAHQASFFFLFFSSFAAPVPTRSQDWGGSAS